MGFHKNNQPEKRSPSSNIAILYGFVIFLLCISFQKISLVFVNTMAEDVKIKTISKGNWEIDLNHLAEQTYYLSVGRPRTPCNIEFNNKTIANNTSHANSVRTTLLLGGTLKVSKGDKNIVFIKCDRNNGFDAKLSHRPVVSSPLVGMLVQLLRAFTEIVLGPLASIILLILALIYGLAFSRKSIPEKNQDNGYHDLAKFTLIFASVSLFYSLSLGYYPMLFVGAKTVFYLHIVLRFLYSLALTSVLSPDSKFRKILLGIHLCVMSITLVAPLIIAISPLMAYKIAYSSFPLIILATYLNLHFKNSGFLQLTYSKSISISWLLSQTLDTISMWSPFGIYYAPVIIGVTAGLFGVLIFKNSKMLQMVESGTGEILIQMDRSKDFETVVGNVMKPLTKFTRFNKVSAYIDAYIIGEAGSPHQKYLRLKHLEFKNNEERDEIVRTGEGDERGAHILEALKMGILYVKKGRYDNTWFAIIPISKFACINLTSDTPYTYERLINSFEFIHKISPSLDALGEYIGSVVKNESYMLKKIRLLRGRGDWKEDIGLVFSDVNDYDALSREYGHSFLEFIAKSYFPAFIKYIGKDAFVRQITGDEILFMSINNSNSKAEELFYNTIEKTITFNNIVAPEISKSEGFPHITITSSAHFGIASIISDKLGVRVEGAVFNEAHRILEVSAMNSMSIHEQCFERLKSLLLCRFEVSEKVPIISKKAFLFCRRIKLLNNENKIKKVGS